MPRIEMDDVRTVEEEERRRRKPEPPPKPEKPKPPRDPRHRGFWDGLYDHFAFRSLDAARLVRFVYITGIVAVGVAMYQLMGYLGSRDIGGLIIRAGVILSGLLAIALWRMLCELMIILFLIHDRLAGIEKIIQPSSLEEP